VRAFSINEEETDENAIILNEDKHENDHAIAFLGWKRNSCFVHTLQLVVKEFEKAPCFNSKVKNLAKKVNKSCKATEMLIKTAKRKLASNCPTRWDSTYLMISRLKDHIL